MVWDAGRDCDFENTVNQSGWLNEGVGGMRVQVGHVSRVARAQQRLGTLGLEGRCDCVLKREEGENATL